MAVRVVPCGDEDREALPRHGGGRGAVAEHPPERVAPFAQFRRCPPKDSCSQYSRRRLAQGTGADILSKADDAALLQGKLDPHCRATKRGTLAGFALGGGEMAQVRDVGRESQDTGRVELQEILVGHGFPSDDPFLR
jgi:hypothetical protein